MRWATVEDWPSFIIAAVVGALIAVIIKKGNEEKSLSITFLALFFSYIFNLIPERAGISDRIFMYFTELEYMARNDRLTAGYITLGYLILSLVSFALVISIVAIFNELHRK